LKNPSQAWTIPYNKYLSLPPDEKPIMPYDWDFLNGINFKTLPNFIGYSDKIKDYEYWANCTYTIQSIYIRSGMAVTSFGNAVAVSKNGGQSSILATAYHLVAPWLNDKGECLDDKGHKIGEDYGDGKTEKKHGKKHLLLHIISILKVDRSIAQSLAQTHMTIWRVLKSMSHVKNQ